MLSDPNVGTEIAHFRVLGPLGAGGMGVVYRAEDMRLRREVALKVLPADRSFDAEQRKRFLREARSAAAVKHAAIATVYDVGEDEHGVIYIAMELVSGRTLRSLLAAGPLSVADATRVTLEVARGVARAHEAGIVHRDIKPDNVMVDDEGQVKILDFGLAKAHELGIAESGTGTSQQVTTGPRVLGTPDYMSPEQALGASVGPETDVFAMGVLLYELIAGERPFKGQSSLAVIASVLRDAAPPLRDVPPALASLVAACLDKDLTKRPRNGRALVLALTPLVEPSGRPPSGLPPSAPLELMPTIASSLYDAAAVTESNPRSIGTPEPSAEAGSPEPPPGPPPASSPRASRGPSRALALVPVTLLIGAFAAYALWSRSSRDASVPSPPEPARDAPTRAGPLIDPPLDQVTSLEEGRELRDVSVSLDGGLLALVLDGEIVVRDQTTGAMRTIELPERGRAERVFFEGGESEQLLVTVRDAESVPWAWRVPLGESPPTRLFRARVAVPSPERTAIAYTTGAQDRDCQVRLRDADGEDHLLHSGGCAADMLAWSPDGTRIVFLESTDNLESPAQLRVVDRSGGSRIVLRTPRLHLQSGGAPVAFLPDGCVAVVLAARAPDTGCALYRVCPDEPFDAHREPELLASLPSGSAQALSFDRDGRALVLLMQAQADVALTSLDDEGTPGPLVTHTHGGQEDRDATFFDDTTLLFHSNRNGNFAIYRTSVTDSVAEQVNRSLPQATFPVSREGRVIYWSTRQAEEGAPSSAVLRAMALDGSRDDELLPPFEVAFYSAGHPSPRTLRVSCAGDVCALGEKLVSSYRIRVLGSDAPPVMLEGVTYGHAVAPDGLHVALAREDGLVLSDLSGREQRVLVSRRVGAFHSVAWHPNGRWLYATSVGGDPLFELLQVDARTGETTSFFPSWRTWLGAPAISPNGERLAISMKAFDANVFSFVLPQARQPIEPE